MSGAPGTVDPMAVIATGKYVQGRVVERRDLTPDLWSIRVAHDGAFTFKPGQYATLGVPAEPKPLERPYSIVSSPTEPTIEFLLELVDHGLVTPHLHALSTGAELLMRPRAKGRFTLDLASGRSHHLFVATVTGIAPFLSMLRTLRAGGYPDPLPDGFRVVCVHGGSRSDEFGYDDELGRLDRELEWFTYVPTISRIAEDPAWRGEVGRVEDVLRKHLDSAGATGANSVGYLCGHPGMIVVGHAILARAGVPKAFIRQEEYYPLGKGSIELEEAVQALPGEDLA
ncbi:MAG: ferredoxin--NADP reductase [Candidatus Dormibacteria bacterium]